MKSPIELTIIVPCYNEEVVLPQSANRLGELLRALIRSGKASARSRILFVNDGSTDGTWELIENLASDDPIFAGLSLSRNFGHQAALLAGLHAFDGDAAVTIDADLQDDPTAIESMVDRYCEGFDIVYGVRRERRTDSVFKRLTALCFYRIMSVLGARTVYNHADFRLMSRRAVDALRDFREINLFLRGMVPLIGFPSTSVVYDRTARTAGESKYPFRKMLALSLAAVTSFSNVPLRLITLTALAGIAVVFVFSVWVVWTKLFTTLDVPGWASIVLPSMFVGCLNLLAIGVVGEYMARIFDEIKARPRYVVSRMVNVRSTQTVASAAAMTGAAAAKR